ncbi:hypothetical protein Zm00014a_007369 [Zea mays]|uniref:Uncharacterized protein n=1 Tax=Zea mays TaxID=4577 RepID=A0A3L6EXN1_MAIZE|nr:hypothetical protein Zm00014a_007369 [Zea mays]
MEEMGLLLDFHGRVGRREESAMARAVWGREMLLQFLGAKKEEQGAPWEGAAASPWTGRQRHEETRARAMGKGRELAGASPTPWEEAGRHGWGRVERSLLLACSKGAELGWKQPRRELARAVKESSAAWVPGGRSSPQGRLAPWEQLGRELLCAMNRRGERCACGRGGRREWRLEIFEGWDWKISK